MGYEVDYTRGINSSFRADGVFHRRVVTLTSAQVKLLRGTPQTLVPSPGAGWFLELSSVILILDYGSNIFAESTDNLVVQYKTSGVDATAAIETTGFIDAAADQAALIMPATIATVPMANIVNNALELFNTGDGEFTGNAAGDSKLICIVEYCIHKSRV